MYSLKFKLFFAGFLISIIPMILYQYITFNQSSQTLQTIYAKELKQKTYLTTLLINKALFHTISDIKLMTKNIAGWIDLENTEQVKEQFDNFEKIRFDIDSTTLIDNAGTFVYSTNENKSDIKKLSDAAGSMIKEYVKTDMKDIFIYKLTDNNNPKIFILNKIDSKKRHFILLEVNFQNIGLLLANFEDEILGDKSIFLLDKQNRVVFTTNQIPNLGDFFNKNSLFDDNKQTYQYIDYDGDEVISAYDTVVEFGENHALGWKVVTSIPLYVINEKVYETLELNTNIGLLMTIFVFVLLTLLSRNISNSIRVVLNLAKKLENGDYSARVDEKNTIEEFEELTSILNQMSRTIEKRNDELQKRNELFQNLAHYDVLTEIPNRMLFQDRLEHAITKAHRNKGLLALFFIDLDQFKHINDSYGHEFGDEILKVCATRLKSILREEDTVARLGGDEFTIILEDIVDPKVINKVASKIIEIIKEPISIQEHSFSVSCSIGISMYPQDATTKDNLIKYADTAMYKSKALGRNTYQFYSSELTLMSMERIKLEKDVHYALENKEFIVYYQLQVDLKTKTISGVEALIRWNKPQKGIILPVDFLPLAAEIGVITLIDKWVMKSAMKQMSLWKSSGLEAGVLALNLSMKMLEDENFIQDLKNLLIETKCKPEWIELEVTEGQIMSNKKRSIKKLQQISDMGIQISIDDFGTGYSSLSYLKHLPINKLKIDKSFIDELPNNSDDVEITKTILSLAKGLNLKVLAEGVETKEQKEFLIEHGCVNIQGYLYSKPMPAQEMEFVLRNNLTF